MLYAGAACTQVGIAISLVVEGDDWYGVVLALSSSLAWLVAAVVQRRLELAWVLLQGLQVAVGIRDREEGVTYGVVRTSEPSIYLLHDESTGHRFRLTERGVWQREDW